MKTENEQNMNDYDLTPNILVGRKRVEWVAFNHELSEHAKVQLVRRGRGAELDLKRAILNSPLAWKTWNNCIAIAIDLFRYIVVGLDMARKERPAKVVTIIDLEPSGLNVVDKMLVSYREACRDPQAFVQYNATAEQEV